MLYEKKKGFLIIALHNLNNLRMTLIHNSCHDRDRWN